MSLPTKDSCVSQKRLLSLFSVCILLTIVFGLGACGYRLATSIPTILGDGTKTLKVKGVDYPTLHPWLPHSIRSKLRDEIGARYMARWVDSGSADFEIQINVKTFTTREWIRTDLDTAQLYSTSIVLEAIVYDGYSNKEIWRSGNISYSESSERSDEKAASDDIINQIVRRLADRLRLSVMSKNKSLTNEDEMETLPSKVPSPLNDTPSFRSRR